MSRPVRLAAWALLCALLLVYTARHLTFSTDITHFMPDGSGSELARVSRELAQSELARTIALTIGADDPARAVAAAKQMAESLRAHPEVAWLRSGPDAELQERVHALYFPRRLYFLSDDPERELPDRLSDAGLRAEAQRARESLASPASTLLKRVLPEDPLGGFQAVLLRMRGGDPPLSLRDGVFTTRDGRWAVLLLGTKHSAFDTVAQAPLLAAIEETFAAARARHGDDLALEQGGAARFALDAETKIRADVGMIGTLSTLGVALLSWLFFRSLFALGLAMLPALVGLVIAMALGLGLFGRLDGMTIGFGASLIGVTIDYPTHYLILRSLSPHAESAWDSMRRVAFSIVLAALTTIASFAGLAITSFVGFRELGIFSVIGVAGALAATLLLLPDLASRRVRPISAPLAERLAGWPAQLQRQRGVLIGIPVFVLTLGALALPMLRWNDDLSRLGPTDLALQAEEQRVRERIGGAEGGRFVIVLADDAEAALARNDAVAARLAALVARGALAGARSLHDWLWSEQLQRRNLETLRASPELAARAEAAFAGAGFRPGMLAPFARALEEPPPPLTLGELRASPLGELAAPLALDLGERTALITHLRGVRDAEAIRAALEDLPDVHLFEQREFINQIAAQFRSRTLLQILLGSVCVLGVLWLRYRDLRNALAAFLPSTLTAVLVLSGFSLAGVETNLLHAVSLLMVMGMGVDYGIFLVDASEDPRDLGATLVSCLLCCLTTILGFGTLALSSHPALRAIGLTTGLGITLSLLLAPVTLLLLRPAPHAPADA